MTRVLYEFFLPDRRINMAAEVFDRNADIGVIIFELLVLVAAVLVLFFLGRTRKNILSHFFIAVSGIFIFEMFTAPMWNNLHLGWWAYLYRDVSWILTVGWATGILLIVTLVEQYCAKRSGAQRFLIALGWLSIFGIIGETVVVNLGIRTYSPEVREAIAGNIPLLGIPVNALYYIPVFMALVLGFYHYWCLAMDGRAVVPVKRTRWCRDFIIAFVGVFLFELMIEPMVENRNLPEWSYVYRDVSFLLTGGWVVIIWLALKFTNKFFIQFNLALRFMVNMLVIAVIALPVEAWLIAVKIRVYGPSAVKNFTGIELPFFHVPVEVFFAIPLYFALIIAFVRYWEIVLDNRSVL